MPTDERIAELQRLAFGAARTLEGDVCLTARLDESTSGGTCTNDGLFPAEDGIGFGRSGQGGRSVSVSLDQWGDLRIRVEGVPDDPLH